jgi:hypothetical protein
VDVTTYVNVTVSPSAVADISTRPSIGSTIARGAVGRSVFFEAVFFPNRSMVASFG